MKKRKQNNYIPILSRNQIPPGIREQAQAILDAMEESFKNPKEYHPIWNQLTDEKSHLIEEHLRPSLPEYLDSLIRPHDKKYSNGGFDKRKGINEIIDEILCSAINTPDNPQAASTLENILMWANKPENQNKDATISFIFNPDVYGDMSDSNLSAINKSFRKDSDGIIREYETNAITLVIHATPVWKQNNAHPLPFTIKTGYPDLNPHFLQDPTVKATVKPTHRDLTNTLQLTTTYKNSTPNEQQRLLNSVNNPNNDPQITQTNIKIKTNTPTITNTAKAEKLAQAIDAYNHEVDPWEYREAYADEEWELTQDTRNLVGKGIQDVLNTLEKDKNLIISFIQDITEHTETEEQKEQGQQLIDQVKEL